MGWYDLIELDRIASQMAELEGRPLPEVVISPRLQHLMDWVEQTYGVNVLARPHTFMQGNFGMTSSEEGIVTVYAHPNFPEDESVQILAHEAGHCEQKKTMAEFDRAEIDGYVECETDADQTSYKIAEGWGEGHLFPPDYRQERAQLHADLYTALDGLSFVSGISLAHVLVSIAHKIIFMADSNLGEALRKQLGKGQKETIKWKELGELCFDQPEWLVGFDRTTTLLSGVEVTRYGDLKDNSIQITNPEDAAVTLHNLLSSHQAVDPRISTLLELDGQPTKFILFDGDFAASAMLHLVHQAMLSAPGTPARVTWEYTQSPDQNIYLIRLEWKERDGKPSTDQPNYCIALTLDGYELKHERVRRVDDAVRFFVNTFAHNCGILERRPSELWETLLYWTTQDRDEVDPYEQTTVKRQSKNGAKKKLAAEFQHRMDQLLAAGQRLDIATNPDPAAIFEVSRTFIQIWCTPVDHPEGWESAKMSQGDFPKPCALVAGVHWDNDERVLQIRTERIGHENAGTEGETIINRPQDVLWTLGKILDLCKQASIVCPPISLNTKF